MIKLRPCPFCGTPGHMKHLGEHYGASCPDWKCQGMQGALMHRDEKSAAAAWNRRASSVASKEEPKRMRPRLIHCAAGRDGECVHDQCPQLRDGEPGKSGRHCPLDTREES